MRHLLQMSFLFFVCLAGEGLAKLLPFAFPGSIMSMFLLLLLLLSKLVKEHQIQDICDFLLHHMAFFFLPAGIGIMEKYQLLQGRIISFLLICLLTTVFTFFTTAFSMKLILALQKKGTSDERTDC